MASDLCSAALEAAGLLAGGEGGDIFIEDTFRERVLVEDQRVLSAESSSTKGATARLQRGGETRHASASSPSAKGIIALARDIAAPGIQPLHLTADLTSASTSVLLPLEEVPLKEKAELCLFAERVARKNNPLIKQVKVALGTRRRRTIISNPNGIFVEQLISGANLSILAVASDGIVTQTGYEALGGTGGWELMDRDKIEALADMAARRAAKLVAARTAPGGKMAVVLAAEAGGTMVHEAVGHGLEGDLVLGGHSIYEGKLGKRVASPLVSVIDDPTIARLNGAYAFDDEGTPAAPSLLIEDGILKRFLTDRKSAGIMGLPETASARRESYLSPPIPRMSNTIIAPGESPPAEVLAATSRGLYVTRMGGGEVNTLSGEFVFEVSEGFIIEDGEVGELVRGATIAGNGPEALNAIDMVGDDLGYSLGTCGKDNQGVPVADGQPTIRISELIVGGRVEQ
ncbi:MAG: peptidase C69 [Deltaproteobacteria bacterium]|nr:MAG: peptidase C69 [Deltaproteobacteria bacterium]